MSVHSIPDAVVVRHFPLAAQLWPQRGAGFSSVLRAIILIALGTALLTLSAKVNLPLPYVPMTLQTLVVLMIGAAYGWLAFGMKLGVEKAWLVGIAPFLAASLIKNTLGAALVPEMRRLLDRRG